MTELRRDIGVRTFLPTARQDQAGAFFPPGGPGWLENDAGRIVTFGKVSPPYLPMMKRGLFVSGVGAMGQGCKSRPLAYVSSLVLLGSVCLATSAQIYIPPPPPDASRAPMEVDPSRGMDLEVKGSDRKSPFEPSDESDSPKKDADLLVPLSEVFRLRSDSGLPIKDAFVDREKIVKLFSYDKKRDIALKAIGVGLGDARITIVDIRDGVKSFKVRIAPSLDYLERLLELQFPSAHVKLQAGGDNILFVQGTVDAPSQVDAIVGLLQNFIGRQGRIINMLRTSGVAQVQLDVLIARVDRNELRRLNVNFLASNKHGFVGSQIGNLIGVPGIVPGGGLLPAGGAKVFSPSVTNGQVLNSNSTAFFGITNDTSAFFGFINFLKQNNAVKVLANPTLVTMNGRPADFLVGGEQPVPIVVFAGGTAQPSVQFKQFGTRLTFVPIILGDGKIRLDVLPEVSTLNFAKGSDTGGVQVPQFVTQRIHTTVEMEAGQTLFLGGLLQTQIESSVDKIPILGDLPGVGAVFRKVAHQRVETELIIVVTPRMLDALRECQKPDIFPGQETREPTDTELFLFGKTEVDVARPLRGWLSNPPIVGHPAGRSILVPGGPYAVPPAVAPAQEPSAPDAAPAPVEELSPPRVAPPTPRVAPQTPRVVPPPLVTPPLPSPSFTAPKQR